MKKSYVIIMCVLVCSHSLIAQVVADGWQLTGQVSAGDSLWGGWDLISGLDLDNDGNKEFIMSRDPSLSGFLADRGSGQIVEYFESTGDDQFELRWSFQAPIRNDAGNVYTAIAMANLDGDDQPELYFGTPLAISDDPPNPRGLYVFEFDGSNFPSTPSETWNFSRPDDHEFKISGMASGDIDGDGEEELVIQSRGDDGTPGNGGGRTTLIVNSGGIDIGIGFGAFQIEFEHSERHTGGVVYDPRVVDFDNDGQHEVWVFTWDFFSLAIYEATAANTYDFQVEIDEVFDPEDFGHRRGMRFYDADGDGLLEFYTTGIQPSNGPNGYIFYIANTSDVATLGADDIVQLGGRDLPADGSAVGDLDGDELMDFLFTGRAPGNDDGTRVYRMEYSGVGALDDSASYEWSTLYESDNVFADLRNVAIDDLDGDNKTEVLVTRMNALDATDPVLLILESATTEIVEQTEPAVIDAYVLAQNYPNPFNAETHIEFTIEKPGEVQLVVYDASGQLVQVLHAGQLASGEYRYHFRGDDLASGIYFYSLQANDFRATKSMILTK